MNLLKRDRQASFRPSSLVFTTYVYFNAVNTNSALLYLFFNEKPSSVSVERITYLYFLAFLVKYLQEAVIGTITTSLGGGVDTFACAN